MNAIDTQQIAALARAWRLAPRQLLVAAARLARNDATDPVARAQRCRELIADARAASPAAESIAALLSTPIASYAQDDIDRALITLWPPASDGND